MGPEVVFLVVFEHVLLILLIIFKTNIPDVPERVRKMNELRKL